MPSELLPCPFCGKRMIRSGLDQPANFQWWEHEDRATSTCPLKGQTVNDSSKVFKKAWNTRAPVVADLDVEAMRRACIEKVREHFDCGRTPHHHDGYDFDCVSEIVTELETVTAAPVSPTANKCVKCGHRCTRMLKGKCSVAMEDTTNNTIVPCGCKCEFEGDGAILDDFKRAVDGPPPSENWLSIPHDNVRVGKIRHFRGTCDVCGASISMDWNDSGRDVIDYKVVDGKTVTWMRHYATAPKGANPDCAIYSSEVTEIEGDSNA